MCNDKRKLLSMITFCRHNKKSVRTYMLWGSHNNARGSSMQCAVLLRQQATLPDDIPKLSAMRHDGAMFYASLVTPGVSGEIKKT